jgi:hypothetical protein
MDKINKEDWNEVLNVSRKKLVQVFLAGAAVATLVWITVFIIYLKTGFML